MHFSDFVYTPTLLDYSAAVNNAGMLPGVAVSSPNTNGRQDFSQQQQGKKPDYAATIDDNFQRQQHYSSPSQQQYNFGFNGNSAPARSNIATPASSSVNTPNHKNSPSHSMSPPPWLHMSSANTNAAPSSSQPILLNHPADDPQQQQQHYMPLNSNFNNNVQPFSDPQTPQQQPNQPQSSTPNVMKNYYDNAPHYSNNPYY
ncbi:hypothetical protein G6F42_016453 [Rhizopus arrhizus]|nr:hypothetical protein G6F42_016453 [Rhizopus arrhizus]